MAVTILAVVGAWFLAGWLMVGLAALLGNLTQDERDILWAILLWPLVPVMSLAAWIKWRRVVRK